VFLARFGELSPSGLWVRDDRAHCARLELRDLLDGKVTYVGAQLGAERFERRLRGDCGWIWRNVRGSAWRSLQQYTRNRSVSPAGGIFYARSNAVESITYSVKSGGAK
jgi:hypothetical protein